MATAAAAVRRSWRKKEARPGPQVDVGIAVARIHSVCAQAREAYMLYDQIGADGSAASQPGETAIGYAGCLTEVWPVWPEEIMYIDKKTVYVIANMSKCVRNMYKIRILWCSLFSENVIHSQTRAPENIAPAR